MIDKYIFIVTLLLSSIQVFSQEVVVISKRTLNISEPSDICRAPDGQTFLVLGGKGYLYRYSAKAEIIETSEPIGYDLEAVCTDGKHVFVSEENFQRVIVLEPTHFNHEFSFMLPHGGGRNQGREACCYLPLSGDFLFSTEKHPQYFSRLNESHTVTEEFVIPGIAEVSALTEWKGKVYALSDEDATIYQIDLEKKSILRKWRLNIINPEGLVFVDEGRCIVVSDDEASWYELELK